MVLRFPNYSPQKTKLKNAGWSVCTQNSSYATWKLSQYGIAAEFQKEDNWAEE